MTPQEQLAQSMYGKLPPLPPFPFMPTVAGTTNVPVLGNTTIQARATGRIEQVDVDTIMALYRTLVSGSRPSVRLDILKRHRFTQEGRQSRIEASLVALNVPQPTVLTVFQWKELIEEIEEED